jgi:hypothetical protein
MPARSSLREDHHDNEGRAAEDRGRLKRRDSRRATGLYPLAPAGERDAHRRRARAQERIARRIDQVAANPYGSHTKSLTNLPSRRAARVGSYRRLRKRGQDAGTPNVCLVLSADLISLWSTCGGEKKSFGQGIPALQTAGIFCASGGRLGSTFWTWGFGLAMAFHARGWYPTTPAVHPPPAAGE